MTFLKNYDKHIFRFITIFVRENLINYMKLLLKKD